MDEFWIILWVALYVFGGLAFWVAAFRVLASDPTVGVTESESKHEAIGTILIAGFCSLVMAIFWPIIGMIFAVWKYGVAPAIKSQEEKR